MTYTIFLFVAAGLKFLLLMCILLAPATVLYVMARRERGRRLFSPVELAVFVTIVVFALIAVTGLVVGFITI